MADAASRSNEAMPKALANAAKFTADRFADHRCSRGDFIVPLGS